MPAFPYEGEALLGFGAPVRTHRQHAVGHLRLRFPRLRVRTWSELRLPRQKHSPHPPMSHLGYLAVCAIVRHS